MSRTAHPVIAALVSLVIAAIPAAAQEPRSSARDVMALVGTVDRVDVFSRSVTVKKTDGFVHSIYIGPELEIFRELKTGDTVVVRIVESVIVALAPGAKTTSLVDTT